MVRQLWGRLLASIPVVLGVSLVTFLMLHLVPGDPVAVMYADAPITGEQMEEIREELGLNDPLYVQYGRYIAGAVRGDLGNSIRTGRPVSQEIRSNVPHTVKLTTFAIGIALVTGLFLGCAAALRRNTWLDAASMAIALLGVSMPSFWLGLMLMFIFSVHLNLLPATGGDGITGLILPATALGMLAMAIIARVARSSMLEVLGHDYIRTARAKGLRERVVVVRHALRNALIPIVTIVSLQLGLMLSGAVIIETVFSRQGVGRMIVEGILAKDFPIVQGAVLFTAIAYVLINLVADLLYVLLDPRIHYG